MKILSEYPPSDPVGKNEGTFIKISAERPCGARKIKKKCERDFPTINYIKMDTRNHLGDIFLDLMRIAMDGDQHEFDNEKLGEHISAEI